MIKPIFTIGIPNATQEVLTTARENVSELCEGYNVLIYSNNEFQEILNAIPSSPLEDNTTNTTTF